MPVRVPVAEAHADLDEPGGLLGATRPARACIALTANNTRHEMRVVRHDKDGHRPAAQLPGFTQEASRNRIAPKLAEDWGHTNYAQEIGMDTCWMSHGQGSEDSTIEIM